MRELDRERSKMEQQEKKIIADIKKMAKQGQMDAVKVMAKVCYLIQSKVVSTSQTYIMICRLWQLVNGLFCLILFPGPSSHKTIRQKIYAYAS